MPREKLIERQRGVNLIICLLNDYELRTLGVSISEYKNSANKLEISFIQYPIIEMGSPDSIESLEYNVLVPITEAISQGQFVLVHCRGGVGRAGTVAACVLKKVGIFADYKKAIGFLRKKRDKRCVESRNQEDFVKFYFTSSIFNKV